MLKRTFEPDLVFFIFMRSLSLFPQGKSLSPHSLQAKDNSEEVFSPVWICTFFLGLVFFPL